MENNKIEIKYLAERICMECPPVLEQLTASQTSMFFELMKSCGAGENIQFVVGCYSRYFIPRIFEKTCLIHDNHYLEFLVDLEKWYRQDDDVLIQSIFLKYILNFSLARGDYEKASFCEWMIKEKGYNALSPYSLDDHMSGLLVDMATLFHEAIHFHKHTFVSLENFVKYPTWMESKSNAAKDFLCEVQCDFLGLVWFLNEIHQTELTQEMKVELYYKMIVAICFYHCFYEMDVDNKEDYSYIADVFLNRALSVIGLMQINDDAINPKIDWKQVDSNIFQYMSKGLHAITKFIGDTWLMYFMAFYSLPDEYRKRMSDRLQKEEKRLRENRKVDIFPELI